MLYTPALRHKEELSLLVLRGELKDQEVLEMKYCQDHN